MPIQGMKSVADYSALSESPENWREGILLLYPNGTAPLYALTGMMGDRSVDSPKLHWFDEELESYRMILSADIDNSQTTIPVVAGAKSMKPGDILYVEQTGEHLMVVLDPSAETAIEVSRGHGGSTATLVDFDASTINPYLFLLGCAYEEGSDAPEGRTLEATERDNNTQIFRTALELTNTVRATNIRTGDALKHDKRRCLARHSATIERYLILGRKSSSTHNGRPRRTMDGIINQLESSLDITVSGGQIDMDSFETYMMQIFLYGSNEKLMLCGNRAMLALNQMCRRNSDYIFEQGQKEYGMNVRRYISPFGTLVVKIHPLFNQIQSGTNPTSGGQYYAMDSWGLVLDMEQLKYVYLQGRDTKFQDRMQLPGKDGLHAGYLTECSLQLTHPKTHALLRGLYAGVADS